LQISEGTNSVALAVEFGLLLIGSAFMQVPEIEIKKFK